MEITPTDRARLMLNLPDLANRFVEFAGVKYPILHLSIGDLEQFRAACAPIEAMYLKFSQSEMSLLNFMEIYTVDLEKIFIENVPIAAGIALRLPTTKIVASNHPLEAFTAILTQWVHNLEIGALQKAFPAPESDDKEKDDQDHQNPLSTVQKLMSAYHCSFEDAISRTTPQIYLMGVDAAWSYENIKTEGKKKHTTKAPPVKDGKRWKTAEEYRQYLGQGLNRYQANMTKMGISNDPRAGSPFGIIQG